MLKKYSHLLVLGLIILLYLVIRIRPLQFQTVAYTYDQGRDFLKAAEMIINRRPTFIGPTTGISGLYHGAWWYYVLAIPFTLFRGAPMGFYYFNMLIHVTTLVVLFIFIKKYFGLLPAIISGLLVSISPYFIFTSLFAGNNIMVLPVMAGFLMMNFLILEAKNLKYKLLVSLLAGLFLGLIGEFELSFGLFLIPTYLIGMIIFRTLRSHFIHPKNAGAFLIGLFIAFLPRMLFEAKNQFIQTKTLMSFFFKPKLYNPKAYIDVLKDRILLFRGYWEGLFPNTFTMFLISLVLIALVVYILKNKTNIYYKSLLLFSYLVLMLFALSTFYKDNFWANYYEGIQYIFMFIIVLILSVRIKIQLWTKYGLQTLVVILTVLTLWQTVSSFKSTPKFEGLAVQRAVVSYVLANEKNTGNYCVRIYTPPVIPYTYNYLFLYEKLKKGVSLPNSEWVNGTCWFIMEEDPFKFRLQDWKKVNEPQEKALSVSRVFKDVTITHYEIK